MLRVAAIGMLAYGLHDVVAGLADLIGTGTVEWWANAWRILSGSILALAAAFVRVSFPGGLALALAGLLGLQSISLHNDPHVYGRLLLWPQLIRAGFGAGLVALAYWGWGAARHPPEPDGDGAAPS